MYSKEKQVQDAKTGVSVRRRLAMATYSRLFWDGLASCRVIASILLALARTRCEYLRDIPRKLDRLMVAAFDIFESVRTLRWVDHFGQPHIAAVHRLERIRQHPRYRRYWHDPEHSIEIGIFLGGDFVRHKGRYYPVELGLDSALFPARRAIYSEVPADPIVTALVNDAAGRGFKHLFLFHHRWWNNLRKEFEAAASARNIRLTIGSNRFRDSSPTNPMSALPANFPDKTLCVAFHGQRRPMDYYVSDKRATSLWLQEEYQGQALLGVVRSAEKPFVPPLNGPWPNLVVKRGGDNFGRSVVFVKVKNAGQLALASQEANRRLRRSWFHEAKASIFQTNTVVYQQFISPELTQSGHPRIIRAHFLFTPNRNLFLSSHYVVSAHKPPVVEFGGVYSKGLVVNRNVGGHYERTDPQTESDLKDLAEELGVTLRSAITKRFLIAG